MHTLITRKIEIDAGHRVPSHGSKCRNWHGHRYVIEARCYAKELIPDGEQEGMVLDFGFLKEIMVREIHDPCDHGMIIYNKDPWLETMLSVNTKIHCVNFVPTAENLAAYWYRCMYDAVIARSKGYAYLDAVRVWETPNCTAVFYGSVPKEFQAKKAKP